MSGPVRDNVTATIDQPTLGNGDRYLVVFSHDNGWRFSLPIEGEIIIGRAVDAQLHIRDSAASRHHAKLLCTAGDVVLVDLGSRNGVTVNGDRVEKQRTLRGRDAVQIGTTSFLYQASTRTPAAATRTESRTVGEHSIILADPAMLRLYDLLARLAQADLAVLITGETGVGKEHAAQALHAGSSRRTRRLITLNCAALPENLVESELFGYERGAFSGAATSKPGLLESSDGGTVFLDEVGELPLTVQAKLLRALETRKITRLGDVKERSINIRVVSATNRDLAVEVQRGTFRADLYFRLSGAKVWLPPLRDRPSELRPLAMQFLTAACTRQKRPVPRVADDVWLAFTRHGWPGNLRELKNVMEYVAATADGPVEVTHLPAMNEASTPAMPATVSTGKSLDEEVRALEQARMTAALDACDGNQSRAAEMIGMPRRTFTAKMKQYGLRR